ncbi:MAG: thioredoxin domain-containing protein [Candidatus Woesearchaeota archaeon]
MVTQITDQALEDRIVSSDAFVCVAFLQAGGEHDKRFLKEYEAAAERLPDNIEFYWINATENPSISQEWQIRKTPTTVIYVSCEELERYVGFYDADFLVKNISDRTKKRRCY